MSQFPKRLKPNFIPLKTNVPFLSDTENNIPVQSNKYKRRTTEGNKSGVKKGKKGKGGSRKKGWKGRGRGRGIRREERGRGRGRKGEGGKSKLCISE